MSNASSYFIMICRAEGGKKIKKTIHNMRAEDEQKKEEGGGVLLYGFYKFGEREKGVGNFSSQHLQEEGKEIFSNWINAFLRYKMNKRGKGGSEGSRYV